MDIIDIAIAKALAGGSGGGGGGATPIVITLNDPTAPSDTEVLSAFQNGVPIYIYVEDEWYKSYTFVSAIQDDKETHDITALTYTGSYAYASGTGWHSY